MIKKFNRNKTSKSKAIIILINNKMKYTNNITSRIRKTYFNKILNKILCIYKHSKNQDNSNYPKKVQDYNKNNKFQNYNSLSTFNKQY